MNLNLIKGLVNKLNGTIVECNTAYKGIRNDTNMHIQAIREHGFLESMVEAVSSVVFYIPNMLYINVMNNISIDCDCSNNQEDPCIYNIGIIL